MPIQDNDFPKILKTKYDSVCSKLDSDGWEETLIHFKKTTKEELENLKNIDGVSDEVQKSNKTIKKEIFEKIKDKDIKYQWESTYILEYFKSVKKAIMNKLEYSQQKILIRASDRLYRVYQDSLSYDIVDGTFELLAELQGQKLIECWLKFLEFCDDRKYYNFAIFDYKEKNLRKEIKSIKFFLRESQVPQHRVNENSLSNGLKIYWIKDPANDEKTICKIDNGDGENKLQITNFKDYLRLNNVETLLGWKFQLSDFIGRSQELKQLNDWLDIKIPISIQLIYGDAGVGKTRLAFHFAKEAKDLGWEAGKGDDLAGDWCISHEGILLIIDYPEEQQFKVKQFVKALNYMSEIKPKIRILILSRGRDFLEELTIEAPGFINQPLIYLSGLKAKEEQMDLLQVTWDSLRVLHRESTKHQTTSENNKKDLPIDESAFNFWLKQNHKNSSPLFIIALAVYLFEKNEKEIINLQDLQGERTIRALTKREKRRILNEIEDIKNDKNTNKEFKDLEPERVLLIRAMATITNGLDCNAICLLIDKLKPYKLLYQPPEVKHLIKLSIWKGDHLPALKPDILASDFLDYCLKKWAINQGSLWTQTTASLKE
jgi:hypothetical protein